MKKKQFLILLAFLTGTAGQAQLRVQDKGLLFLEGGAVLTVQGDIDSKADVLGSGVLLLNGTSLQRINMNGFLVSNLQVDNRAGVALESDVRIGSQLLLNAGKMSLNAATLSLASGAGVTGYDKDHFIITNGAGLLVKEGLGADGFVFPVGSNDETYRPVRLVQGGTRREIGVRAMPGAFSNGDDGIPLTSGALNLSWEVKASETDALGMNVGWEPGDELPGFDRSQAGIVWFEKGKGWGGPAVSGVNGDGSGGGGLSTGTGGVGLSGGSGGIGSNGGRFDVAATALNQAGIFSIASRNTREDGIRVHPNPATTGFYVEVKGKCQLELYDQAGKLVQSRNAAGGTIYFGLDRGLSEGLYLLRIVREGLAPESRKIMVVR